MRAESVGQKEDGVLNVCVMFVLVCYSPAQSLMEHWEGGMSIRWTDLCTD